MKRVMRLDPFHRAIYFSYLANAYYVAGEYEMALETSRTAVTRMPGIMQAGVWYSAAAGELGRNEEARMAAAEVLRLKPDFTITRFLAMIRLANQEDARRLADGLRKAGLPE